MNYITAKQCRAGRALLDWSQPELAKQSSVHIQTISNFENGNGTPSKKTLDKITIALELGGIEFVDGGAREAETVTILRGHDGFNTFLDDVYKTILEKGTAKKPCDVFISNAVHQNWIKWMGEKKWKNHVERMEKIKNLMNICIIVREGDYFFPAQTYSRYKWFPKNMFNDKSFYSYDDKLVFLNFKKDDVEITIMRQPEFSEGYRNLFKASWEHVGITPPIQKEEII